MMHAVVKHVLREERKEMSLRKLEKKLTEVDNLVKHEDTIFTIFARPKRTWFQSSKERDDAKKGRRK